MATDPDRPNEGAWSELERGFFASAPPDVPGPAPEPMRFDDLESTEPPPRIWRARLSRAWATTDGARRALRSRAPAVAAAARLVAGRALRGGRVQAARLAAAALQGGRVQAARLAAVLRSGSRDRRIVAVAAAALIVVTSVSAGVVASRGGGGTAPGNAPRVSVGEGVSAGAGAPPVLSEAEIAPPALMTEAEPETAPSSGSIAPEPSRPPPHRRKHAKPATRHSAPTKAAGTHTPRSIARR